MREKPSTSVCLSHIHMVHYAVSLDTGELDLLIFQTFKPLVSSEMQIFGTTSYYLRGKLAVCNKSDFKRLIKK